MNESERRSGRTPAIVALVAIVAVSIPFGVRVVGDLLMTRKAVATYVNLIMAANMGEVEIANRLCSRGYLAKNPLVRAGEGGIINIPRSVHRNFRAWRSGPDVMLCPTNRVGPVYRFILEDERWVFDGPAGLLDQKGRLIPAAELPPESLPGT